MSSISIDDVKKVARLSGLQLAEPDLEKYRAQFAEIIDYIERLNEINTIGVEPTYQVTGLKNVKRTDEVIDYGVSQAALLKNAPSTEAGQVKVERVL